MRAKGIYIHNFFVEDFIACKEDIIVLRNIILGCAIMLTCMPSESDAEGDFLGYRCKTTQAIMLDEFGRPRKIEFIEREIGKSFTVSRETGKIRGGKAIGSSGVPVIRVDDQFTFVVTSGMSSAFTDILKIVHGKNGHNTFIFTTYGSSIFYGTCVGI